MTPVTAEQALWLHEQLIERFGGKAGVLNMEGVRSAVEQPFQTFDGNDLYPSIEEKAATLCFLFLKGHHFLDGNKRTGFTAMVLFLELNGYDFDADWSDAETHLLRLANDGISREQWVGWVRQRVSRSA